MSRMIPSTAAALVLMLGAAIRPAAGQTVVGRVVDATSGEPVPQVQVTLLTAEQRTAGRGLADAAGRFAVPLRSPGAFTLRAERTGYRPTLTQELTVGPRDTLVVDVRISSEALRVEALTVTARRQPQRRAGLDLVGFYRREAAGLGRFLHREDIERNANMNLVQILDRVPGTMVVRTGRSGQSEAIVFQRSSNAGAIVRAQRGQAAHCLPQVYLDGNLMQYDMQQGLNGLLQSDALEAVEVYTSTSQVPAEFNTNASCGVILLWSKRES